MFQEGEQYEHLAATLQPEPLPAGLRAYPLNHGSCDGRRLPLHPAIRKEANMQQSSPKLVKVGIFLAVFGLGLIGCSSGSESGVHSQSSESGTYCYAAFCEGVEPGPDLTLFDTLHFHRAGAQLALSYDFATRAFTGMVENTTEAALRRVRVEVHLSNGTKLSLTNPVDLAPGQAMAIILPTRIQTFLLWSACPKVG